MDVGTMSARTPQTLYEHETVLRAAQRMLSSQVSALVVTDDQGRARGVVTGSDLVLRCMAANRRADATPVAAVMSREVHTVADGTSLESAMEIMAHSGVDRLVVVDEQRRVIGMVSLEDLLEGSLDDQ
ncbi:MAG TPA: CBS domain-containing protein, partial [Longimicrobiales bacterium]|nr:CBS domain-containing protein [Longimicrobiales bacterium]